MVCVMPAKPLVTSYPPYRGIYRPLNEEADRLCSALLGCGKSVFCHNDTRVAFGVPRGLALNDHFDECVIGIVILVVFECQCAHPSEDAHFCQERFVRVKSVSTG
jgi:hypothetical protein